CKLDTKPQPQWVENWMGDSNRNQIYNDWARLNQLKIDEAVFEGDYTINSGNLTPKIHIYDDALPATSLKNVVILANFDVISQNVVPNFPYTGTWFDLMDETGTTSINVTNTAATITIPAGQFRIFGNQASTLSIEYPNIASDFKIYPNPANHSFKINKEVVEFNMYDLTGQVVRALKGNFTPTDSFD